MLRTFFILISMILSNYDSPSQIVPGEGKELNYRLIGFSFPASQGTIIYTLEIAKGNYTTVPDFKNHIILSESSDKNKIVTEVPSFGCEYTWRVLYNQGKSGMDKSEFHHFKTGGNGNVTDTNVNRLRVTDQASKFKDAFVFVESVEILYDMQGNPVWYLPLIEGNYLSAVTDLKLTPQGTITFLTPNQGYEINYNGDVLWKTPAHKDGYHHQLTRLKNGHYMILAKENIPCVLLPDSCYRIAAGNNATTEKKDTNTVDVSFDILQEYDEAGKLVWSWNSSKYYAESDVSNFQSKGPNDKLDMHANSFYFNEQTNILYIGYKNINRIVKIKYPEGTVISSYGQKFEKSVAEKGDEQFCAQHAVNIAQDGSLYLFNNNRCNPGLSPKVEKFLEPTDNNGQLQKVWEYECSSDVKSSNGFPMGGNIMELSDKSIFVSTAGPDSKIFIINADKKILWKAIAEIGTVGGKEKWTPKTQYRASIIENRQLMEQLIWNAAKTNIFTYVR